MRLWFLPVLLLVSCAHSSATSHASTNQEVSAALPPGCDRSIAGEWVHEDNASYRYTATDDGKIAYLIPRRVNGDGTLVIDPADKDTQMKVTLERRADGFTGEFRFVEAMDDGAKCPLLFLARITSCSRDRLVLQLESAYGIDSACQRVDFGQSDMVEHVLVRVKP